MDTAQVVKSILTHHGVKGMKWGVRRDRSSNVTLLDKGKKVKTSGGFGHPAHPDALRARTSGQIAKKSGLKALSNKELQDFNQRLNLEQQAKRLAFQDQTAAKRFIQTLIGKKAAPGVEAGTRAVLNSAVVRRRAAIGAAALALG